MIARTSELIALLNKINEDIRRTLAVHEFKLNYIKNLLENREITND